MEEAQKALMAAKVEAQSAYRGVGLVKLMGRSSGFIAMNASMASGGLQMQPVSMPYSQSSLTTLGKRLEKKEERKLLESSDHTGVAEQFPGASPFSSVVHFAVRYCAQRTAVLQCPDLLN